MMLHNALDRAVKEKLILSNPTENCIIPKIEKQEMKILHPDHISAYLNAAERRNALPMFYLELVSGLRKGELVALQWSDLDEANCTISVSKQASWDTEHQLILSRPKTGNSIREVSIPQDAVELLKQEHAKHPSNPWMFPSGRTGEMYHPDSVVTLHKRILKDAGLEHIRFHDLRHTFATLALQKRRRCKKQCLQCSVTTTRVFTLANLTPPTTTPRCARTNGPDGTERKDGRVLVRADVRT